MKGMQALVALVFMTVVTLSVTYAGLSDFEARQFNRCIGQLLHQEDQPNMPVGDL